MAGKRSTMVVGDLSATFTKLLGEYIFIYILGDKAAAAAKKLLFLQKLQQYNMDR